MTHSLTADVLATAGLLVVGLTAAIGMLWRFQERLVFQPPRPAAPPAPDNRVRQVAYAAEDGQALHAYLVGSPTPQRLLVVAFHGNADLAEWMLPWALDLHARTGAAVLLPEYRGYGALSGRPTYRAGQADARAALTYVSSAFDLASLRMTLFGHSLGTAIATELAVAAPPAALVLQSPFTSARAMASRLVLPTLLPVWDHLSRVHYDTLSRVVDLDVPVHVAHGNLDRVVPVHMGMAIHASARRPGTLLLVSDAGHNNVPERARERYWKWLTCAIDPGMNK